MFNVILLSFLRNYIPQLFTNDQGVIDLVASVLPLCAAFQLFDALAANCNGLLRGLGRQEIGGWVNLFCYYVIAMPISFGTAFGLGWQLEGLWSGVALALGLWVKRILVFEDTLIFLTGLLLQRDGLSTVLTGNKLLRMPRIGIMRDKKGTWWCFDVYMRCQRHVWFLLHTLGVWSIDLKAVIYVQMSLPRYIVHSMTVEWPEVIINKKRFQTPENSDSGASLESDWENMWLIMNLEFGRRTLS